MNHAARGLALDHVLIVESNIRDEKYRIHYLRLNGLHEFPKLNNLWFSNLDERISYCACV